MCCCTGNFVLELGFGSEAARLSDFTYDVNAEQG